MNALSTAGQPNFRLDRIKIVSRLAKYICIGILIYSIGFRSPFFRFYGPLSQNPFLRTLLMVLIQIGLWFWYRKMTRLPDFHDRIKLVIIMAIVQIALWTWYGKALLSSQTLTWRGVFSLLPFFVILLWYWNLSRLFRLYEHGRIFTSETIRCFKILGLLCVVEWLLSLVINSQPGLLHHAPFTLPPGATLNHTSVSHLGFFNFDFGTGINFGPLFVGMTVVLIAWIMDEGRKIKEEQELTV